MSLLILSDPFFRQEVLGNTLENYVWFTCILLTGFIFKRFISKLLSRQLYRICKKYSTGVGPEKFLDLLVAPFNLLVMLLIAYLAFDRLIIPPFWNLAPSSEFGIRMILTKLYLVLLVASVTWILLRLTDYFGLVLFQRASLTESKSDDQLVPFIKEAIKIIIVLFGFLFMLGSVFQVNVASLVAGLGIGGLAVALAAKESLENLLGSFTIFLDKPFTIGDLVKIDSVQGHVEKIGFRSTRIRTQEKTFVTVPNKKMVEGALENLTLRASFRAHFSLGLAHENHPDHIRQLTHDILSHLQKDHLVLENIVVRLKEINSSSLDLFIQYFVNTSEWEEYVLVRERINYRILELVKKNNCSLACPVNRIWLENQSKTNPANLT